MNEFVAEVGHIVIMVAESNQHDWHTYWDSEIDSVCRSRVVPGAWKIMSRYYGRGTRNHPVGLCFRSHANINQFDPICLYKRFRIILNDNLVGEMMVPLESTWIQMTGLIESMQLPVSIRCGQFELLSIDLRDIRSTIDYEMSGIEFVCERR